AWGPGTIVVREDARAAEGEPEALRRVMAARLGRLVGRGQRHGGRAAAGQHGRRPGLLRARAAAGVAAELAALVAADEVAELPAGRADLQVTADALQRVGEA